MPLQDGHKIQEFVDNAYAKAEHMIPITAEQGQTIAQHAVVESRRGLVQDGNIYLVGV